MATEARRFSGHRASYCPPACRVVLLLLALSWVGVFPSAAQQASSYQIQGMVVDGETGIAAPDAEVKLTVLRIEEGVLRGVVAGQDSDATTYRTGLSGTFAITAPGPGMYSISALRDGYKERNNSVATISKEFPTSTLRLEIFRAATVSGRLVDAEDKQPLQGVRVIDLHANFRKGRKWIHPVRRTVTDKDGMFAMENLLPGEHILLIESHAAKLLSEEEADKNSPNAEGKSGVYRTMWPSDGRGAMGISVVGGSGNFLGDILVTKTKLATVQGVVRSSDCSESDQVEVWLTEATEGGLSSPLVGGAQPCGEPWLITHIPPGEYQVEAWIQGRTGKEQRFHFSKISLVEGQPVEVEPGLVPPMTAQVTLRDAQDNAYVPEDGVQVSAIPVTAYPSREELGQALSTDSAGEILIFFRSEVELQVSGLRQHEYVKELKYNNTAVQGGRFTPSPASVAHKLEVVVGSDKALVSPVLSDEKDKSADTAVLFAPWPPRSSGMIPEHVIVHQQEDGSFQNVWLPPGKYRAIATAVPQTFLGVNRPIDRPGVLLSALADSDEITLGPGERRQPRIGYVSLR